jgi:hypothetical protein
MGISRTKLTILVFILALSWAPYLTLATYWRHLLATVPGASHGEVSGPILNFLPKLLAIAIFATFGIVWFTLFVSSSKSKANAPESKPTEETAELMGDVAWALWHNLMCWCSVCRTELELPETLDQYDSPSEWANVYAPTVAEKGWTANSELELFCPECTARSKSGDN